MTGEHSKPDSLSSERKTRPLDISKHCLEGGTWVTNLTEEEMLIMQEAVRKYGDPRLLVHAQRHGSHWLPGGSLHYLGDEPKGGSWQDADWGPSFWRVVERLTPRHDEWLKLRGFAP